MAWKTLLGSAFIACLAACSVFSTPTVESPSSGGIADTHGPQDFDSDWKFALLDTADAWRPEFDDSTWRRVDLPHDWSIEDLPPAAMPATASLDVVSGSWRFRAGDDPSWKAPEFDDSAWQTLQLPHHWSAIPLKAENAFAWYRRRIDVAPELRGKDLVLLLGKIDDSDETFVNGVKVGGTGSFPPNYVTAWEAVRRYPIAAGLLKGDGTDLVAVRNYNGQSDAGIYESAKPPMRSGPFDSEAPGGTSQGYTRGGIGWYRKTFSLSPDLRGRWVSIDFDGVYMDSELWLNGQRLGSHPYGYTAFHFDLTPHLRFAPEENVLSVRVNSSGKTSRWYSGSGIYRHVRLTIAHSVHLEPWGVSITTPSVGADRATVRVRTAVANGLDSPGKVTVVSQVMDSAGVVLAKHEAALEIASGSRQEADQELHVDRPALWSPSTPALYRMVSRVVADGQTMDELRTPFGFRSIAFDAERGFLLNGEPLELRGGCVHHDNGCLGSRAYDRAEERRVELLKSAGFNAIRTSHNPPSSVFLDACDRRGMLVMDEAFDCWARGKNPEDYGRFFGEWWRRDIESMVLRDRNHPSVVFWSIGNEIPGQGTSEVAKLGALLAAHVRALDPSRPVTQGAHPDASRDLAIFENLEICGYNYMPRNYAPDHEAHPKRVMAGTESFPIACFESWMPVLDHPYVIGDFVWTAFDYLGEAGLGKAAPSSTPPGPVDSRLWTVSNCGDFDLCGFKRPPSYYRDVVWGVGAKVCCFTEAPGPDGGTTKVGGWNWGWPDEQASWSWPGHEGRPIRVHVYSSAPRVRLSLNGREIGVKATDLETKFTATWDLPFESGELVAVALDTQGQEVAHWTLRTAGKSAAIRLRPDRSEIAGGNEGLSFVAVEIVDAEGTVDPTADTRLRFSLSGPGKIAGVGNGDPRSTESFQGPTRKAYRGRCLVVIQGQAGNGTIRLRAEAPGLESAEVEIRTR